MLLRRYARGQLIGPLHYVSGQLTASMLPLTASKALALVLLLCVVLAPCSGGAQAKQSRVGILSAGMPPPASGNVALSRFMQGLSDLGWTEGQNFILERRYAAGKLDRLPALAQQLVRMKVDVIVTNGPVAIRPAFEATRTIPIVMIAGSADPVGDGFAASLARPGGNVTGLTWSAGPDLLGKNLELLKQVIPGLSRVALLNDGALHPTAAGAWQDAAQRLGLRLELFTIRDPAELQRTIVGISHGGADAMYVMLGGVNFSYRQRIADLALARRLPTFGVLNELPEVGGLMSYGPTLADIYGRGATYVDRILKGARPGDLPIEQPTKFELVINLKTAKALGLAVPQSLLLQADHLIN